VPLLLQGCNFDVPSHAVGNWRTEPDYLIDFQYVPPGGSARDGVLNSCDVENLPLPLQCSGRGVCQTWDQENLHSPTTFCRCDRDWADPECKTRRKSQLGAFLLSLFLGPAGADHFYMGFRVSGTLKLLTLGGGGAWWIFDFIRIGSAPVAAKHFNLAADLPHWVFLLAVVCFGMVLGFAAAYITVKMHIINKRKDALMHAEEEEVGLHSRAAEKGHIRRRSAKPDLLIGEPGMQLKFRAAPATAHPCYGAVQEDSQRPTAMNHASGPKWLVVQSDAAEPVVTVPRTDIPGASYNLPAGPPPAAPRVPVQQQPAQSLGPVQMPSPMLGPLEAVAGAAAPPRAPAATRSSIAGFGAAPTPSGLVH